MLPDVPPEGTQLTGAHVTVRLQGPASGHQRGHSLQSQNFYTIRDNFHNVEQVQDALRRNGLESSQLILGFDFTKVHTAVSQLPGQPQLKSGFALSLAQVLSTAAQLTSVDLWWCYGCAASLVPLRLSTLQCFFDILIFCAVASAHMSAAQGFQCCGYSVWPGQPRLFKFVSLNIKHHSLCHFN